jgi:hypothetical protein
MAPLRLAIFRFTVRHLGWFRRVPILVHTFDAFLAFVTFFTAPTVRREINDLVRSVGGWPNVSRRRHRFGGREFDYHGSELGHVHSNGVVDVRLTRTEHDQVLAGGRAEPHHVAPTSSWVTFVIDKSGDARPAAALLDIPYKRCNSIGTTEQPTEEQP